MLLCLFITISTLFAYLLGERLAPGHPGERPAHRLEGCSNQALTDLAGFGATARLGRDGAAIVTDTRARGDGGN